MKNRIRHNIQNFSKRLNYEIKDIEKRQEIVDDILKEMDDYLNLYFYGDVSENLYNSCAKYEREYFDGNEGKNNQKELNALYNPHPKCCTADQIHTGTPLSENDFVCKFLEKLANYLIFDGSETKEEKKQRRFENADVLNESMIGQGGRLREDGDVQANHDRILIDKESSEAPDFGGNYKVQIKQRIFKEDVEKSKILQEYQNFLSNLSNKKRNGLIPVDKSYKVLKIMREIKDDMIYTKDSEFGTVYFREPLPDSGQSKSSFILTDDWTYENIDKYTEEQLLADFFDPTHYDLILKILPFRDLSDNLKNIGKKFDMLETKLELTEDKSKMLEVLKEGKKTRMKNLFLDVNDFKKKRDYLVQCGQSIYDISSLADKLDWTYNKTKKQFENLQKDAYNAFIQLYEEEFYFMNIVRGVYKKCSNCEEIILVQRFGKDSRNKDGLKSICRKCDKNSKKLT